MRSLFDAFLGMNIYDKKCMDTTIPTDTINPKIIFKKSFPIIGKTYPSL